MHAGVVFGTRSGMLGIGTGGVVAQLLIVKVEKELVLRFEISGEEFKVFESLLEKVQMGESASNVGIGILNEKEKKFLEDLIKTIEYVDDVNRSDDDYRHKAQILNVIKTVCNINSFLSDSSIKKALIQAKEYENGC